jgi:hypothetical protein
MSENNVNRQVSPYRTSAVQGLSAEIAAMREQMREIERQLDKQMATLDLIGWEIHRMGGGL